MKNEELKWNIIVILRLSLFCDFGFSVMSRKINPDLLSCSCDKHGKNFRGLVQVCCKVEQLVD